MNSTLLCGYVKSTYRGTSPNSPILQQKQETALTVQLICAIFRSEFSSCELVTCSQRWCTWQHQIAGSVFQWRRSQGSVDVSFSPFFDLITDYNSSHADQAVVVAVLTLPGRYQCQWVPDFKLVIPRNVFHLFTTHQFVDVLTLGPYAAH